MQERHRRLLAALLQEHLPDVEAWAYGSRVNGRSHDGSDLDLALRGPGQEAIPSERMAGFRDAVRESTIPFLVEARDWARLPQRFRREMAAVFWKPPSGHTHISSYGRVRDFPRWLVEEAGQSTNEGVVPRPTAADGYVSDLHDLVGKGLATASSVRRGRRRVCDMSAGV